MLVITAKQLIETLQKYDSEEILLVTWWSTEDVEMIVTDEDIEKDRAKEIWNDVVWDLDDKTSDHVISYINDELDTMVYEKMEQNNED